jgi:hypothetical protein
MVFRTKIIESGSCYSYSYFGRWCVNYKYGYTVMHKRRQSNSVVARLIEVDTHV